MEPDEPPPEPEPAGEPSFYGLWPRFDELESIDIPDSARLDFV